METNFGVSVENVSVDGALAARPVFEALNALSPADVCWELDKEIRQQARDAKAADVLLVRTDLAAVETYLVKTYGARTRDVLTNDVPETLLAVDLWRVARELKDRAEGSRVAQDALGEQTELSKSVSNSTASRSLREPIG